MIAKLMGVTYLKNKLHRSSSTTSTTNSNPESTTIYSNIKESTPIQTPHTTIKRSKSIGASSIKGGGGKLKKHSNSNEIVTRSQVRRSNTVPSGIALKNFSTNRNPERLSSLPNSPSFNHGLAFIDEFGPASGNSSQASVTNYNLTPNNSGSNLMSLLNGYLTVDYNGMDDTSSLYTGKSNTRLDNNYDSDDYDDGDNDDPISDLWVLPRNNNKFSIPRTHETKKKNVRFI